MGDDDKTALAVMNAKLDHLASVVEGLAKDVKWERQQYVTRNEWELRTRQVDSEIGGLKDYVKSRHTPWWNAAAIVIAGLTLLYVIIRSTIGG